MHTDDHNVELPILVSMSEIARLFADKGNLSAVTNWRARAANFPADRSSGSSQPRYDVIELMEWLVTEGPRRRPIEAPKPSWWWQKAVEAFLPLVGDDQGRSFLVALILLRQLATSGTNAPASWQTVLDADESLAAVAILADRLEHEHPEADGLLVDPLGAIAPRAGVLRELIGHLERAAADDADHLITPVLRARRTDVGTKRPWVSTAHELAQLMTSLGALTVDDVVFDPAMGEGVLLNAVRRRVSGPVGLNGQEIDLPTWRIARSRFLLQQVPADLGNRASSSLTDDQFSDLRADVVVIDPPIIDGGRDLDRWIDHGLSHLGESGRLVIALPAHAVVDVKAARRHPDPTVQQRLAELLDRGALEAAVVLPRRVRSDVVGPLIVFVFHARDAEAARTLVLRPVVRDPRAREQFDLRPFVLAADSCVARWRSDGELEMNADVGIAQVVAANGVVAALQQAIVEMEGTGTGKPEGSTDQEVASEDNRLREQLRAIESSARALEGVLADHLDELYRSDPKTYDSIRTKLDKVMQAVSSKPRPGR